MNQKNNKSQLKLRFIPEGFIVDQPLYEGPFKTDPYKAIYNASFNSKNDNSDSVYTFIYSISDKFLTELTRTDGLEISREKTKVKLSEDYINDFMENVPFASGSEYVTEKWIKQLWNELNKCFSKDIKKYKGSVALYLAEKDEHLKVAERIFFHLVENKNDSFPFSFLATYSTKKEDGSICHAPLKYALTEYKKDHAKILELLSCLNRAGEVSPIINEFIESGEMFHPLKLTTSEAYQILKSIPAIEETGIVCRIPDWWKKKRQRIQGSVSLTKKESILGLKSILKMEGFLELDGKKLTKAEIKDLLNQTEGLAKLKGKWVEVDHRKLNQLLQEMEGYNGDISMFEAFRKGLYKSEDNRSENTDDFEISNNKWISSLLKDLRTAEKPDELKLPESFTAKLRPYQESGYSWLSKMMSYNFGACLADDMGLGKTIQILALLETLRISNPDTKVLLVVPVSLLGNWQNECRKFAPQMQIRILHNSIQKKTETDNTPRVFLNITSYSMLSRLTEVSENRWDYLILDEAQAIKNPSAKQTKIIKEINAVNKIALTGTPIENDLTNLWSLYDFLNKGLLGTMSEFKKFCTSLSSNNGGYARLKAIISPFMLRRLKTDKNIISDLPEKIEMTDYISLSNKQQVLYKKYVQELADDIEKLADNSDINKRRELVLTSIMKLKQICNHPDQYTADNSFAESDSGKFTYLRELCETIYEKRERVLIFTQFREMCEPLNKYLETLFGIKGFVLHGGTTVPKRNSMVKTFQSDEYIPYMIISVKAGGTGLNLTNANHVVHFDRWWNPAVENQATDRAFRIGQNKNVMVHKFICTGTIEEKIDELIRKKTTLAHDVIGADSGENWITEMTNEQLMNLFSLES